MFILPQYNLSKKFSHLLDTERTILLFDKNLKCLSEKTLASNNFNNIDKLLTIIKKIGFTGEKNQNISIPGADYTPKNTQLTCVGIGDLEKFSKQIAAEIGATIAKICQEQNIAKANIFLEENSNSLNTEKKLSIHYGICLGMYSFQNFLSKKQQHILTEINYLNVNSLTLENEFKKLKYQIQGQLLAKDLMHMPSNKLTPKEFSNIVSNFNIPGLEITILNEEELKKENMHALLAVGQGSREESFLAIMNWKGGGKNESPIALVGKGICYDSGGINLKTSMQVDMKYDMGGAATVVGAMFALAKQKTPHNVVGVIALAENMPSGNAIKPGDIISSRAGKSILVANTDAEGRLILADAIDYTIDTFKPKSIIDLATLTGSMIVSLGYVYAGFFSNCSKLSNNLTEASKSSEEKIWQLPLDIEYDNMIKSPIADMQNLGTSPAAGSITAAQFIQRFTKDTPWAHIDIAGTAWVPGNTTLHTKGPTGWGVNLLCNFINQG